MGGESTPWGISVGSPHTKPALFTVADPREPQARAKMISEFANFLLKYFCHPRLSASESALQAGAPIKQLWIPDPSHLDLLHQIAYGYAFANGPLDDMADLNDLGRLLNCLFIQWQHPGQQMVMIISDCLRSMYTFPASPVRQHHLGFLTAWLADDRTRTERLANATEAEETSISTTIDGAIAASFFPDAKDTTDEYVAEFSKINSKYNPGVTFDNVVLQGMNSAMLTVQALRAAGKNLTRAGLIKAIETKGSTFASAGLAPLNYSATSRVGYNGYWFGQLNAKGELKPVGGKVTLYTTDSTSATAPVLSTYTRKPLPKNGIPTN